MGVRLSWGDLCSSRTTSAPESPAPRIRARFSLPFGRTIAACSENMRRAKREPPIRIRESSQSIPRAERGIPGRTLPVTINRAMTPEASTEAVVTATVISRSSPVLAYIHSLRYRPKK